MKKEDLTLIANSIRVLSMDAVQKANSGHPGMPLGCAEIAAVLWGKILKYNPGDPAWVNRDRFILSAGHGSMLLYSILHLAGYDISIEDIKQFRQMGSITPGHPEFRCTPGVETTTGPLGQGFANAIGMSIASDLLSKEFNTGNEKILDHYIYAIVSDGDIMEGVTSEAASLAGHMGLGNIIFIYDDNKITIEGKADLAISENTGDRFRSYGWHVQNINGHNFDEIEQAVLEAQKQNDKPSIIIAGTTIAKGCPSKEGSESTHGSPLGQDAIQETKENIACESAEPFEIPSKSYELLKSRVQVLQKEYGEWQDKFNKAVTGDLKKKWDKFFKTPDIENLRMKMPAFDIEKKIATRSASGKILEALFAELPNLAGGSADLGPSNKTFVKGYSESGKNTTGRNIHFGIREHAMGSIQNGIAYYGGFISFSATFFVFLDYMRPPVRLAALSKLNSIFIFTHDSIFVGEDGPTHQPIEHLAAARAIPNLTVIRPADAEETAEAWLAAIGNSTGPTALILTRQDIPVIKKSNGNTAENLIKGAYVIYESDFAPDVLIIASGSEVSLSIEAAEKLKEKNINARVVSFPSWELFEKQTEEYRKKILPDSIRKRVVVELGIKMGWEKYAGDEGLYITVDSFGMSAPHNVLAEKFGFTADNVANKIIKYLD
ncbi:MAG: transketolase [Spirochaetes bacterium]|nr:transketolase [Spirochaetota bacterium]